MIKYDTNLWSFLQKNDEKKFNIWSRIKLAEEFARKEHIKIFYVYINYINLIYAEYYIYELIKEIFGI